LRTQPQAPAHSQETQGAQQNGNGGSLAHYFPV